MTGCFGVKHKFRFKCDFEYFRAHKKVNGVRDKNILHWNYFINFASTNRNKTIEVA